jgi:hypothetical protein
MRIAKALYAALLTTAFISPVVSIEGVDLATLAISPAAQAEARIGHPLTPMSYAGVARRTTRRVEYARGATIAALPGGCIYGPYYGSYYYRCGSAYYARSGGAYVQVIINP